MSSTSRVLITMMKLCFANKNMEMLNEYLILLTKRRGQLKQVCTSKLPPIIHLLLQRVANQLSSFWRQQPIRYLLFKN